jgi:hypothetical protein
LYGIKLLNLNNNPLHILHHHQEYIHYYNYNNLTPMINLGNECILVRYAVHLPPTPKIYPLLQLQQFDFYGKGAIISKEFNNKFKTHFPFHNLSLL